MDRWSEARAKRWWQARPWACGFNFLPSTAVNFIEMWHPASFDPETIDRELGWAGEIGFNAMRVNLPFQGWLHDGAGLKGRLDRVMAIAARHGLDTVPCLFDDCGFGGIEPVWGPQPDPLPGIHNSRAIASPGRDIVRSGAHDTELEAYVRDMVRSFGNDPRVLFWDLYNEPGNRMDFTGPDHGSDDTTQETRALALMENCFAWARSEDPDAPLTVAAWTTPLPGEDAHPYQTRIDRSALLHSDIITFHAYWNRRKVGQFIDYLAVLDRPILCTEWMARAVDSRISDQLGMFHDRGVGCFQWGLVKGRTQTWLPWPDDLVRAHGGTPGRDVWFHDLLHADGAPYDASEVSTIRDLTKRSRIRTRSETG